MWVEKHRPSSPYHMVGNDDVRRRFMDWLKNWRGGKPVLLLGPPGTGKTTLVHSSAKDLGFTVIELNASDVRTKDRLGRFIEPSTSMSSVLGENLLLFLDEVDGIYGRQDYGGMEYLLNSLGRIRVPVVLSANVEDDERIRKLASKCEVLRMKRITPRVMEVFLTSLARREGLELSREVLESIVKSSRGDMRAAVNTLQSLAEKGVSPSSRDTEVTLTQALDFLFNSSDRNEVRRMLSKVAEDPKELLGALYSSVATSRLDGEGLAGGMRTISHADALLGRIMRTQRWSLYRYFLPLVVHGLLETVPRGKVVFNDDALPWNLKLRIWNDARAMRAMAKKIGALLHCSSATAMDTAFPYLLAIISKDETYKDKFHTALSLDEIAQRVLHKEVARVTGALK